jgi:hypothetical protein
MLLGPYEPIPGFRIVIVGDGGQPTELVQRHLKMNRSGESDNWHSEYTHHWLKRLQDESSVREEMAEGNR